MCTLSWQVHGDSIEILFSRDELHTRAPASPPCVERIGGTRVLAPRDVQGGGTWLAANEHGLVLCLLNHYPDPSGPDRRCTSRGLLVRALSPVSNPALLRRQLHDAPLHEYRPFTLVAFWVAQITEQWLWDGRDLVEVSQPESPVSTSSLYPRLVPALRRRFFRNATGHGSRPLSAERQMALHRSRRPWPPAFGVAMLRRDRGTVSLTRVRATPQAVAMDYWQGDPASPHCQPVSGTLEVREPAPGRRQGGPGIRDGAASAPHTAGTGPGTADDRSNSIIQSYSPA